ncbi:hypothetical protein BYT27DRAFT_7249981 [Phlegmacium glaucopus]|nr:hypothetical protein BYT27DRAFT_7249981 [Phlegmacium glaucopus]
MSHKMGGVTSCHIDVTGVTLIKDCSSPQYMHLVSFYPLLANVNDATRQLLYTGTYLLAHCAYNPTLFLVVMSLEEIHWNNLYATQPDQQHFSEVCIQSHFTWKHLEHWGIVKASIRLTGWHEESGAASSGGHLVVNFQLSDGTI